ncbi:MAG: helix-turn-helix domain-containing protein [Candidatus Omnitrophica bacterium]|jgi:DNA-binding XRE family transcriptional regulator|nr:helix-turn-helix domain-containing protein [Candidatus Omnitrophota bacterium]
MNISKYFWNLNQETLKQAAGALKDKNNPKFIPRAVDLLSRCQKPKEVFAIIHKQDFVDTWPKINTYWRKYGQNSDFRNWWQAVYEQIVGQDDSKRMPKGSVPFFYLKIGNLIREARISAGWSQKILALKTGMRQPDISKIEEGRKNITLWTLARLCAVLGIKKIEL